MPETQRPEELGTPTGRVETGLRNSANSTPNRRHSQSRNPIRKNKLEEIRVELSEHNGHDLINLRVWADPRNGGAERIPTRAGIACRVALLPELISALRQAEVEARERGLI